ncbi:IclR family transcriptional regulator [Rhodospirillum rubrum]|uniref:IclR family transcriptional regulator n=1 Tax=Rhodospirillum rubrum TaxID=1085 RepID=UPI001905E80A|nr:helix-turn-helix domain-containing protein [Rhodospirillum rubrum]MBK1662966.1 IclR family transcriptional regulator [Rhodospirillum rubrum]MBK1675253.1 IclR family transcriptional regulator [Rhodospirillum rubrum]
MDKSEKPDRLFVSSLDKAMRLLGAFSAERPEMGLGDLALAAGLDKSAAQRFAHTFHSLGYLDKDPVTRRYRPSIKILDLTNAYLWANPLIRAAMPRLIDLRQKIGETVNLALLDGESIVYAIRLPNARTSFAATLIGRRAPALNTASGRVMIAGFDRQTRQGCVETWPLTAHIPTTLLDRPTILGLVEEAAEKGYAISENEILLNERDIAAPIRIMGGPRAAVQCSVSAMVWPRARIVADIVPALLDTANALSQTPLG